MDGNKDEAERCMELGERYLREKKYEEAEKFVRKAQKLYSTKKGEGEAQLLKSTSVFSIYDTSFDPRLFFVLYVANHELFII